MHCHICQKPIEDLHWKSLLPLVSPDMPYPEQTKLLTDYGINTMFPLFGRKPEWVEVCDGCNGRHFYFFIFGDIVIDPNERLNWLAEAQPVAERVASVLSGLTSKRHIYAALKKLGFKPFTKKAEGTAAGIRPRVRGDFVVKSMFVVDWYAPEFCLPTLILKGDKFVPLLEKTPHLETEIVLQPLCDNDMRRITPMWSKEDSPCNELNGFIEAAPNNIGIWKGKVCLLDW